MQYNVFNPNYNVYCAVKQVLEYLPCGKVITSSRYDVLKLAMYESTGDKLYGILDAVLMLLSGYFVWMQVQYYKAGKAAVRARLPEGAPDEDIRRQALKAHFSTVWNWIDVPVIVLYLAGRAMWLLMYLSSKRQELKPAEDKFYDLTDLAYRYRQSYALDGMVVLLLCVKFFKYFKLNPRLNTIIMTVTVAGMSLWLYFLMFILAFGRYVCAKMDEPADMHCRPFRIALPTTPGDVLIAHQASALPLTRLPATLFP